MKRQSSGESVECPYCGWSPDADEEFSFGFVLVGGPAISMIGCEDCGEVWRDER